MDQPATPTPAKLGIKIERPTTEKVSFFYFFLLILSLFFVAFTAWLLILEWTGNPLPIFLKFPIVP